MNQDQPTATDPVWGMPVEIDAATDARLTIEEDGLVYYFCGRGCKLDFGDDPRKIPGPGPHAAR